MKAWFALTFATLVVAVSSIPPLPSRLIYENCIRGCECTSNWNYLQISKCQEPLILNEKLLSSVNSSMLNTISFKKVIFGKIEENAFKKFKELEDIQIEESGIGEIEPNAFDIKRLLFRNVGFEDKINFISNKLKEITFDNCQLKEIPLLDKLRELTYLNLTNNLIQSIDVLTFTGVVGLEVIDLSNNNISVLPSNVFINNLDMNTLILDNNPLKYFSLNTSTGIELISLKNCQLDKFDHKSVQHLIQVDSLDLSDNNIDSLPKNVFENMTELEVVQLSNNQLTHLDDNIFLKNKKLKKVVLDGNKLETLPDFETENKMFRIYRFSCANCGIKTLSEGTFKKMSPLTYINLSNNELENVEDGFTSVHSLEELYLGNNKITLIGPKAFSGNSNLKLLDISGNPLRTLNPEIFMSNIELRTLNARNTQLTQLWVNHDFQIIPLKHLLIGNNKLETITKGDMDVIPNLKSIELRGNPLKCTDNFLYGLLPWLRENKVGSTDDVSSTDTHASMIMDNVEITDDMVWLNKGRQICPDFRFDFVAPEHAGAELENIHNMDNTVVDYFAVKTPEDDDDIDENDDDDDSEEDDDDDDDDDEDGDQDEDNDEQFAGILSSKVSNFGKASYILSITSIFVFTALVVLVLVVTATLLFLRRNGTLDMHKANLPRFKIPIWHTANGQKKHSGSVYRPLSEDLSGPTTPKFKRYEFTSTPTVHSTNP